MNNKTVAQKFRFLNLRIEILKNRLENILETENIKDYGGFKYGMFPFVIDNLNPFRDENSSDELRAFICDRFSIASDEYHVEYHIENIIDCILPYFRTLINEGFDISDSVLKDDISVCNLAIKSISNVISELEKIQKRGKK